MLAKINPVGVFPRTATEIWITSVGKLEDNNTRISWCLRSENEEPLVWGESEVGPEAHQNWGTANPEVVMDLTLAQLGLTRAQ